MPTTLAPLTKAQDQIIETIESVQERVIDTNQKVAATLSERFPTQFTDRQNVLPGLDALPRPAEAIDSYFDFIQRVTKANHKFAAEIVKVWTPAPSPAKTPASKTAAAPKAAATKSATKKAPARKRTTKKPAAKAATK